MQIYPARNQKNQVAKMTDKDERPIFDDRQPGRSKTRVKRKHNSSETERQFQVGRMIKINLLGFACQEIKALNTLRQGA